MHIPGSTVIYFISYPKDRMTGQKFVSILKESKKQVHVRCIRSCITHIMICKKECDYVADLSSIICSGMCLEMSLLGLVMVSSSFGCP